MKKIIFFVILILNLNLGLANSAQELVQKIKNIQSMTANFNQKLIDSQNDNNINSKGSMSLKKPHFFKWTTTSPNNQLIDSNGQKLWIYDGDLEQLIIKKVSNNIAQFPYLILLSKNANNIDKLFTVKEKDNNSYTLIPKNDQMINNITINFTKDGELKSLEISTSLNQFTKIEFSNIKTNIKIDNNDFDFKTPKDTDVIDESKPSL